MRGKPNTSNIWKTRLCIVKRGDIWDPGVRDEIYSIQCKYDFQHSTPTVSILFSTQPVIAVCFDIPNKKLLLGVLKLKNSERKFEI